MHFQCCVILQGTLGGNFGIFAASGESTACVVLWKTCSRPTGVRVCLVAQFNFFSTAFDPREWTTVVFWKEDSGRQAQLITPENEGGDETNCPSPPTFFDDLDVLCGPVDLWHFLNLMSRQIILAYHQDCLQLHHLLVVEKEWGQEIHRVSDCIRDLHRLSLNLFQFQ